jgi:hypothetical protein
MGISTLTYESVAFLYENQENFSYKQRGRLYDTELKSRLANECIKLDIKGRKAVAKREDISFFMLQGFIRELKSGRLK